MNRGRQARINPYMAMLSAQLIQQVMQQEYKPPVTIALIAANAALFFGGLDIIPRGFFHRSVDLSLQPRLILEGGQWWRLIFSAFLHADEWHLYYNMSSLVWKGTQLERRYGHVWFAALVSELLLLSHGLYVIVTWLLAVNFAEYLYLYRDVRAVGFSAVLFALKVVLMHDSPGTSQVLGVQLPTKYICWAELFLASYLVPNASFLGHLCGIVVGWLHVRYVEPKMRGLGQQILRWGRWLQRRQQDARNARRFDMGRGSVLGGDRCGPGSSSSGESAAAAAARARAAPGRRESPGGGGTKNVARGASPFGARDPDRTAGGGGGDAHKGVGRFAVGEGGGDERLNGRSDALLLADLRELRLKRLEAASRRRG